MKRCNRITLLALAVAASFQVAHAADKDVSNALPSLSSASAQIKHVVETGSFITLPALAGNARSVQTLSVRSGGLSTNLQQADHYRDAVVYTGQMPSLTRSSSDRDDLIIVMRSDNRFLALYPDLHQLIYGNATGEQTRVTFGKPSFQETDYLVPTLKDMAQQQLTREGASTYQADRDAQGNVVIDILAGFSKAAAKTIVDHEAFAIAQVTTINQALKNSKVEKVRVRLVGTQIIEQDHAITTGTLSDLKTLFHAGIEQYSPDLIAGFFEGNSSDTAIGWGYINGRYTVNALYSSTALRHEVGHNVGGDHCPDGKGDGYGWDNGKTKTIQCGNNIGYYSNPDLHDNYGLAIGKQGQANMARVWRANAEEISAYSPAVVPFEHEDAHLLKQQAVSLSSANGYLQRIELDVPENTRRLVVSAVPGPNHEESSKFSLYLSEGGWPSQNDYDYASREHWNTFLGVATPAAGKWHLAVASKNKAIKDIVIRVQAFTTEGGDIPPDEWPTSLQNPGAENGNLDGWRLESGQFRVVSGQDGITPFSGNYFFTARSSDSAANHADHDQMSQTIALDSATVSKGKTTAALGFMSNGWGDGDTGTVRLIAKDAKGKILKTAQTQTKGEYKRWLKNQLSLALPAEAARLELQVQAVKKAGVTSDVHFDDFKLALSEEDIPVPPGNLPPVAKASASPAELTGAGTVTLSGAGSYDPDKDELSYQWQQTAGPAVTLINPGTMTASVSLPDVKNQTSYRFRLTVTDTHGAHSSQETDVLQKVKPAGGAPEWSSTKTYAAACEKVSWQGKEWLNGWWIQGTAPGSDGLWGVWRPVGASNMHDKCK
ncbi:PKD domain-containing protein [Enterobacteriaceae bacterium C23F]